MGLPVCRIEAVNPLPVPSPVEQDQLASFDDRRAEALPHFLLPGDLLAWQLSGIDTVARRAQELRPGLRQEDGGKKEQAHFDTIAEGWRWG